MVKSSMINSWCVQQLTCDVMRRVITKNVFNSQFGSVFRTYHNPTYFTRRLNRFADIYMSSVSCLLNYPVNYTFYPRRSALPHEIEFNMP